MHDYDSTRRSWNLATRNHNAHKGDQAAFFRAGGDTLFPEELTLLGTVADTRLVHLQCNAGQDSLSLARRGARVTGVDFSNEAIAFAKTLSAESGLDAAFVEAEVVGWMQTTDERFDMAFCSYGVVGWLPDLAAWARGVARILRPGGRLVYVDFHPVAWSVGADLRLSGDDYFQAEPFTAPVGDYVADAGSALGAVEASTRTEENRIPALCWQYGLGQIVEALATNGFTLETLREYPYSNGARIVPALVPAEGRRWVWPDGAARVPLMFGLAATRTPSGPARG